ncbi:FapA family protein, partial [Peribacillus acanthi]|uniref:FapA family protein n=1 Tax=Peribacillus acanthi TaxID=2171554 RepID=UPI001F0CB044
TMDFRESLEIPTVHKGQVIALVHPEVPGLPGLSLLNEPISPEPVYPAIVQPGHGTIFIENETKVVATETGRPHIQQNGLLTKISIIEKLVHRDDVNLSTGNIRFKGDVDIMGNVDEGMVVEANGDINVFKNAFLSSISSKSSIHIHNNVIGSTISSGKENIYAAELVNLLVIIRDQMNLMIRSIQQLMEQPAFKMSDYKKKGFFPLIKILLDKKFHSIMNPLVHFIEVSKKGSHLLDMEWLSLAEQLRLCYLSSITNEFHSLERMEALLKKITEMIDKHDATKDRECRVKLKYALNSTIYCGGDVTIQGQGCFNSKIHSGGTTSIHGVLRGGELYSRFGVKIKETGSEGGVITKIFVPSNGKIEIDLVKEGTVIQIGKAKHTFHAEMRYVTARLDDAGKLIF